MSKLSNHIKAFALLFVLLSAIFGKILLTYSAQIDLGRQTHSTLVRVQATDTLDIVVHSVSFKNKRRSPFDYLHHVPFLLNDFSFCPPSRLTSALMSPRFALPNPDPLFRLRPPTLVFAA